MRGVFSGIWISLRRPAVLAGSYVATAALTAAVTVLNFAFPVPPGPGVPASGIGRSPAQLAGPGGSTAGLTVSIYAAGIIFFCVAAATTAGWFPKGLLRGLLVRQPDRRRLLTGTWAALVSLGAGAVLVSAVVSVSMSWAVASRYGVATRVWGSLDGFATGVEAVLASVVAMTCYVSFGMAVGLVLRSPVIAVALGFGWLFIVESLLPQASPESYRWLPGQLMGALAAGGTVAVPAATAAATLGAYLLVCVGAAGVSFVRADVTS